MYLVIASIRWLFIRPIRRSRIIVYLHIISANMNSSSEDSEEEDPFHKKYIKLEKIAEGTYGVVWKAKNTETSNVVAIKVFKNIGNQGLPVSAVRQIHILKKLKSPYVLQPLELHIKPRSVSMVSQWKQLCLSKVIKMGSAGMVPRKIMREILKAVASIHSNHIIHRDLKPANIVLDNFDSMNLKIIDFGMSREMKWGQTGKMTNEVGTLYYRAPELLSGSTVYTSAIDIWAIGCIFYELLTKEVLFKADNQILQLLLIYQDIASHEEATSFQEAHPQQILSLQSNPWARIRDRLQCNGPCETELDLLSKLVKIDPTKRVSCAQALQHEYFSE